MFVSVPRQAPSRLWQVASPMLALVLAVITGAWFLALQGLPVSAVLYDFLIAPLTDNYSRIELLGKATPLLICALGLAVCYRAKLWNIGGEGQFLMGAIAGGALALHIDSWSSWMSIPIILLAGMIAGALWAALAAWLRTRWDANEVLTTIMLNYIALNFLAWCVNGPLKDPHGFSFPESALFADSVLLPSISTTAYLSLGALIAAVFAALFLLAHYRAVLFYRLRLFGYDQKSVRFSGGNPKRLTWQALAISGAMAGLAGVLEIIGPVGQLTMNISFGFGYTAIIVAFLGRLHPTGIVFASLLMALTYLGGENLQLQHQLPKATTSIFQGALLLFLLACDFLVHHKLRFHKSGTRGPQTQHS